MNLAAIADLVTKRVGMVGPNDVTACKTFLTQRHDQLYRSKLWKDALIEYVFPINPGGAYVPNSPYLPTRGILILPGIFAHVIAARTSEHKLDIQRPMVFYRIDQDVFAQTGEPLDYFLLGACVWDFDVAQTLALGAANQADNAVPVNLATVSATDGVSEMASEIIVNAAAAYSSAGQAQTVNTINKPASQGPITLGIIATIGQGILYTQVLPGPIQAIVPVTQGAQYQIVVGLNEVEGQLSNGFTVYNMNQVGQIINLTAAGATLIFGSPPGGLVLGFPLTATITSLSPIITLNPADLLAPRRQRIRLANIPTAATTLRILGKRTTPPFVADTDSPGVDGMEGPLIGMAYYDMLLRDERGGTKEADDAVEEAAGLLKQLEAEEVYQGASNTRIMPETAFGPDEYYIGPIF